VSNKYYYTAGKEVMVPEKELKICENIMKEGKNV
jgi:hypothetical protein